MLFMREIISFLEPGEHMGALRVQQSGSVNTFEAHRSGSPEDGIVRTITAISPQAITESDMVSSPENIVCVSVLHGSGMLVARYLQDGELITDPRSVEKRDKFGISAGIMFHFIADQEGLVLRDERLFEEDVLLPDGGISAL